MATWLIGGALAFGLWYSFKGMAAQEGRVLAIIIGGLLLLTWFLHANQLEELEQRCGKDRKSLISEDGGL